jgi:hypothetical protein
VDRSVACSFADRRTVCRSWHFYRRISKPRQTQFEPQRPSAYLKSARSVWRKLSLIMFHLLEKSEISWTELALSQELIPGAEALRPFPLTYGHL